MKEKNVCMYKKFWKWNSWSTVTSNKYTPSTPDYTINIKLSIVLYSLKYVRLFRNSQKNICTLELYFEIKANQIYTNRTQWSKIQKRCFRNIKSKSFKIILLGHAIDYPIFLCLAHCGLYDNFKQNFLHCQIAIIFDRKIE